MRYKILRSDCDLQEHFQQSLYKFVTYFLKNVRTRVNIFYIFLSRDKNSNTHTVTICSNLQEILHR